MIDFSQIDKVIHEKGRLAIMTLLMARKKYAFQDFKTELGMSDGNLLTHLRTLVREGYVREIKKNPTHQLGRSWTEYEMTGAGTSAFKAYLKVLEEIVKSTQAS